MMISIHSILQKIPGANYIGNNSIMITSINQLSDTLQSNELSWCSEKKLEKLIQIKSGTIIIPNNTPKNLLHESVNYIFCENPRLTFKEIIESFFIEKEINYKIESSSSISEKAIISKNVKIGHHCIIEEDVKIGNEVIIGHNTVIHKGTKIGNKVKIGSNNTIGGVGFGYVKENDGSYALIHHLGNVVIEDDVEIGNNTCIDRAVLGSTFIRKNAKIDNLVHIAHGVEIGENSLIIANAMIGGSVKIGKNCWIAPSASIINQNQIGSDVTVGMGAVVIRDITDNDIVVGNPAKSIKKQ